MLRETFEPSKDVIWQQIAEEVKCCFNKQKQFKTEPLRFRTKQWEVTLDAYESGGKHSLTHTRIRAPFVNKDGLKFELYEESVFAPISKVFEMKEIEVKDIIFDRQFVIKGNDSNQVQLFLKDERLKRLIKERRNLRFSIKEDDGWFETTFPKGVNELYLESLGTIKDVNQVENLYDLFTTALERLVTLDSAYKKNPRVRLV